MTDYSNELWYLGKVSRQTTKDLLLNKAEGLHFVRDSSTCQGDYVLCVSENSKVSHYIINSQEDGGYRIGDNTFQSLHAVLQFYKENLLDTTVLNDMLVIERVQGRYDFPGSDDDDLPFKKGEMLYVIEKTEEQWWQALSQSGQIGSIPVPYVIPCTKEQPVREAPVPQKSSPAILPPLQAQPPMIRQPLDRPPQVPPLNTLPSEETDSAPPTPGTKLKAQAIMDRNPSAYDHKFLSFKAGDSIIVTKQNDNGLWEGECEGRKGLFPFNHVRLLDQ